jgi:methylglutaconyl-CoA hydratase
VYKLVSPENLESTALEFVHQLIIRNSGNSIALTKSLLARNAGLDQAMAYAIETNVQARQSESCKIGVSAFLSKDKLIW